MTEDDKNKNDQIISRYGVAINKAEYVAKTNTAKNGYLTDEQKEIAIQAIKEDEYLWGEFLKHYDDADCPDDFTVRLSVKVTSMFENADWIDLGNIVVKLRGEAARENTLPGVGL